MKKEIQLGLIVLAIGLSGAQTAISPEAIVFATFAEQESDLARIQVMIESVRAFAGPFKDAPIWVYLPEGMLASESEHLEKI